ncbi:helix-turn-helix domain-containing protein [Burkholderia cepacia]|uniref:helix-turn-helix domain-containing protein n=1 Tax=Burkholderia cepacia TaxID=292 RepID=UPI0038BE1D18
MAAQELHVSTSTVYKWIRLGRVPNLRIARKIAEAAKCNVTELRPLAPFVGLRPNVHYDDPS